MARHGAELFCATRYLSPPKTAQRTVFALASCASSLTSVCVERGDTGGSAGGGGGVVVVRGAVGKGVPWGAAGAGTAAACGLQEALGSLGRDELGEVEGDHTADALHRHNAHGHTLVAQQLGQRLELHLQQRVQLDHRLGRVLPRGEGW